MTNNRSFTARHRLARPVTIVLVVAAAMTVVATAHAAPSDLAPAAAAENHLDIDFNDSWRFHLGDVAGAQEVGFDDSGWELLDLPHTWNNLDGQDGGYDYYRGIGWYRKHYAITPDYAGKRFFVRFEAVNKAADVYVNGTHVGRHEGGFAAFAFDITDHVSVGGDNLVAVKADNSRISHIAPLMGDFNEDGGIYRPVHLLITNEVYITPLDYGSPGVYLTPSNVSAGSADLEVAVKVDNAGSMQEAVTVQTTIQDADGADVATLTSTQDMAASSSTTFTQTTTLANPHLWDGRNDPYLYKAIVQVKLGDTIVDEVEQPLGFRYFHVDPDTGFYLNGQPYDLHGVAMHEGRKDKGRAISDADRRQDIDLIKEVGATYIRLAHYQHAETIYDLCDENGLVIWTEVPWVDYGSSSTAFAENIEQQMRELIRQNYNHPSVFFWGLYNEVSPWSTHFSLMARLNDVAHEEDATRLTTGANHNRFPPEAPLPLDIVAWNLYYGWYRGTLADVGPALDHFHSHHPRLGVSEYGAGASIYHHEQDPPAPEPSGGWHPEEYQNIFHESYWRQIEARPFLWTKSVWVAFDFASDGRDEGDRPGINDKGLITFDRSVKKDAFYWYKANWSEEPVVYITSRRFATRTNSLVEVKIYSNCDDVELLVNDISHGSQTSTDHIYRWADVILASGDNTVRAVCTVGTEQYEDQVIWNLTPTAVTLARLEAMPDGGTVLVEWETAMEIDNVGFNLYRSESPDGPYTRLNETLILSQAPGSVFGAIYSWRDSDVQAGITYYYKLEDVVVGGASTLHGPVSVSVQNPTRISLISGQARDHTHSVAVMSVGIVIVLAMIPIVYKVIELLI